MKKKYFLIASGLLIGLFIYLFYRTGNTVITKLFISLISLEEYLLIREDILRLLPLNELLIYSLPEGLWVFCITLTSKDFYIRLWSRPLNLIFLPVLFTIGLEIFQRFQLTNGRFDWWDILFSILFWVLALFVGNAGFPKTNILKSFTVDSAICIISYLIVYLAHVWQ